MMLGSATQMDHRAGNRDDRSHDRPTRSYLVSPTAEASGVFTPSAPIDHLACPAITSPTKAVAGFSLFPLAQVAGVVEARSARQVLLTRIGGCQGR